MSCTFRLISSMGTEEVTFLGSESPNTSHRIFGMGLEVFGGRLFLRHSMDNFMTTFLPQAYCDADKHNPGMARSLMVLGHSLKKQHSSPRSFSTVRMRY
jgi:hypothetical protein